MSIIKKAFCAVICAALLSSCAARRPEEKKSGEQEITINTNNIVINTEPPATQETLNTPEFSFTTPEPTSPPETMPPRTAEKTDEPDGTKPSSQKTEEKSRETDGGGPEISPMSGTYYAKSSVNVREEPDADSDRVGHLDKGEKVNVTGIASNGWMRIDFKDGSYYVNGSYLSPSEPEVTEPEPAKTEAPATTEPIPSETEPPATEAPPTEAQTATEATTPAPDYEIIDAEGSAIVKENLNVRVAPDASSEKVGMLHAGDRVTITGATSNGWVRIIFGGGEYFVSGDYLSFEDETRGETLPQEVPDFPSTGVLTGSNGYSALNYSNQKAVWFAFLDIDGMLKNADKASFTRCIAAAYDDVLSLGCNTVYVHVRSYGDAYYYSDYFPFTAAYSGTVGVRPPFDPLEVMISEAHSRGLSFHAWINPMRGAKKEQFSEMPANYALKQWYDSDSTKGKFIVYDSDTGCYWLSPAYTAVTDLICSGVAEIVSRYNVDAIHIDDYFYPTTSSSFDKAAFEASGVSDRASWRRGVVSALVGRIYSTVKSCNPSVQFGVSPQGNIENNRDRLYADVETWCSTPGYLDYVVPQIYYGYENSRLPFEACLKQWSETVTLPGVSLVCGIAAYKVGEGGEWSSGKILSEQTLSAAENGAFDGVAYFRYLSLYGSASSSEKLMKKELPGLKNAVSRF